MDLEEIETGLFELVEVTQDMLLAVQLGRRQAAEEFRDQLKTIMDLLKDSNCHIAIFKERAVVRPGGAKGKIQYELADYCFVDHESDKPRYYCELTASLVIDGTRGHPVPYKGDFSIKIVRMPIDDDTDDTEDSDPPPCRQESRLITPAEQDEFFRKIGFTPPPEGENPA